jgi:hypothetical protein
VRSINLNRFLNEQGRELQFRDLSPDAAQKRERNYEKEEKFQVFHEKLQKSQKTVIYSTVSGKSESF